MSHDYYLQEKSLFEAENTRFYYFLPSLAPESPLPEPVKQPKARKVGPSSKRSLDLYLRDQPPPIYGVMDMVEALASMSLRGSIASTSGRAAPEDASRPSPVQQGLLPDLRRRSTTAEAAPSASQSDTSDYIRLRQLLSDILGVPVTGIGGSDQRVVSIEEEPPPPEGNRGGDDEVAEGLRRPQKPESSRPQWKYSAAVKAGSRAASSRQAALDARASAPPAAASPAPPPPPRPSGSESPRRLARGLSQLQQVKEAESALVKVQTFQFSPPGGYADVQVLPASASAPAAALGPQPITTALGLSMERSESRAAASAAAASTSGGANGAPPLGTAVVIPVIPPPAPTVVPPPSIQLTVQPPPTLSPSSSALSAVATAAAASAAGPLIAPTIIIDPGLVGPSVPTLPSPPPVPKTTISTRRRAVHSKSSPSASRDTPARPGSGRPVIAGAVTLGQPMEAEVARLYDGLRNATSSTSAASSSVSGADGWVRRQVAARQPVTTAEALINRLSRTYAKFGSSTAVPGMGMGMMDKSVT